MTPYVFVGLDNIDKLSYLNRLENSIIQIVSEYTKVPVQDIKSITRKREFVEARMLTAYLLRKYTRFGLKQIGDIIGKRDHSTAIYNIEKCNDLIEVDKQFKKLLMMIEDRVVMLTI